MGKTKTRAVFFDIGGTVLKPKPSVGVVYAEVAAQYGMQVDHDEVERIFRQEFTERDQKACSIAHVLPKNEKEWWKSLVQNVFEQVTPLQNFDSFFDHLYDLFARPDVWELYPEAVGVFEKLKKKEFCLGVISNWDTRLPTICKEMGIAPYFDFILASVIEGCAKPDTAIFERAIEKTGLKPDEAVHVGDSIENDYWGAKRAGLGALLICRDGREAPNCECIQSLDEIFERVA